MRAHLFLIAIVVALLPAFSSSAVAQIYSWRDANGTLVLSDRPLDPSARLEVPARSFRSTGSRERPGPEPPPEQPGPLAYDDLIARVSRDHGVRTDLVRAMIHVESGFDPLALSPKGAMGLMQLMPETAADLGVTRPFDPAQNIRGGVEYLGMLLDRFGSEELALAAYNAGPEVVRRYGNRVPPYAETQEYVRRIRNRVSLRNGARAPTIYRVSEAVNGREVSLYTNVKPSADE